MLPAVAIKIITSYLFPTVSLGRPEILWLVHLLDTRTTVLELFLVQMLVFPCLIVSCVIGGGIGQWLGKILHAVGLTGGVASGKSTVSLQTRKALLLSLC